MKMFLKFLQSILGSQFQVSKPTVGWEEPRPYKEKASQDGCGDGVKPTIGREDPRPYNLQNKGKSQSNHSRDKSTHPTTVGAGVFPPKEKEVFADKLKKMCNFLETHYTFRYNVLNGTTEVAKAGSKNFVRVGRRELNGIAMDAMNHHCDCWDRDIHRYVESPLVTPYHPFHHYMESLPKWDGQDRVTPLTQRISNDTWWANGFHRWMLGITAEWMEKIAGKHANSFAPILISKQQGWGKSTFVRNLLPDPLSAYFTESYDLTQPTAAERKLALFGLINLDEFDRITDKKMPLLKTLMQMATLNVRKTYEPSERPLKRIASFIGTSNRRDLLTDETGSRRFLCVELSQPIDNSPIEHAQLYAQLKEELEHGERYWLSKDEEHEIQQRNQLYYRTCPAEEAFTECFEAYPDPPAREGGKPATKGTDGAAEYKLWSANEIYKTLKRREPILMRGISAYKFMRLLPQLADRVHTKMGNGYRLIEKL